MFEDVPFSCMFWDFYEDMKQNKTETECPTHTREKTFEKQYGYLLTAIWDNVIHPLP